MNAPLIRAFTAVRPVPNEAQNVIAPPYDVVTRDEAGTLAADRPNSFLHISRPEIDLPPGTDPHADAAYAASAKRLGQMMAAGVLLRDEHPAFYIYRLTSNDHSQTGIAFVASVSGYEQNRVKRHELTRPDKERDRVRNIAALSAQTGPVLCAYRANQSLDRRLNELSKRHPTLTAQGQHEVNHSIWKIDESELVAALAAQLNDLDCLYIADGHHRSAAAAEVARIRRNGDPLASHEYFLCVAFPHDQMKIYDYNRIVRDLNGLSSEAFVAAIAERFDIAPAAPDPKPVASAQFGLYLNGRWYRLRPKDALDDDPVKRLDVSILQDRLIGPVLNIVDPRTDARIDFVGGVRGMAELERRVDSGDAAAAFALYPTQFSQLMEVADAGALMPPKSTWFEPKLADGLITHVLD
jgi:uncharacterized protein (DUF1015 family)